MARKNDASRKYREQYIGKRFDYLVIDAIEVEPVGDKGNAASFAYCLCDCGNMKRVRLSSLLAKQKYAKKSCGCQKKKNQSKFKISHGMYGTPTYRSWVAMKDRCGCWSGDGKENYKGVSVCDRWMKFENFLLDMGERPEGKTIDRINPYGNYDPDNCRWADRSTQGHNKRASGKTGVRNVFKEGDSYRVRISKRGKIYNIGRYGNISDAAEAASKVDYDLL
jgi:hypothetical protein